MDNTAVQTLVDDAPVAGETRTPPQSEKDHWIPRFLQPLSSLRLTVFLFSLSIFLVFAGTLAQVDAGIWTIVNKYFRSAVVWIPLQIFFPRSIEVAGGFPFPGGWLIGGLLLANLLAAHTVRFRMTWKRSGIFLIHAGLIVMMVSELVAGLSAVEGKMVIAEGETSNFVDVSNKTELAIADDSDPKMNDETVVPESILRKGGTVQHDSLPFDIDVIEYFTNTDLVLIKDRSAGGKDVITGPAGNRYRVAEKAEGVGVDPEQREDAAAVRVTFKRKGSAETLGTELLSLWTYPNFSMRQLQAAPTRITVGGKTYEVYLRLKRIYKPYTVRLIDFRHEVYLGTDKPKDYSSRVVLVDPPRNVEREVDIYMNNPLRHGGETFFQAGFLPDDSGTVLQVVRNPGWLMPYISCGMVSGGMLIHFGLILFGFLRRRALI